MATGWTLSVSCMVTVAVVVVGIVGIAAGQAVERQQPELLQQNQPANKPVALGLVATGNANGNQASLRCTRRLYTYRISQSDSAGRECWDHVSVWSCFGRCDSTEISDWKFPYKRSYHPVCVHAGRAKAVAYLRQCEEGVEPETRRYEYMEAVACNCQVSSIVKNDILHMQKY